MQRAFAAIPAVELAYYASLAAMLMLFFAHCGEVHAFEDFVLILAVAVFVSFDATRRLPVLPIPLPVACGCDRIRAGLWQPMPDVMPGEPFGTHERGARVWAAFAICFSRTEHVNHDPDLPVQR